MACILTRLGKCEAHSAIPNISHGGTKVQVLDSLSVLSPIISALRLEMYQVYSSSYPRRGFFVKSISLHVQLRIVNSG